MEFPIKFNCGACDKEHEANFMAAFVGDDQGNWYFDLGTKKGWVVLSEKEKRTLNRLFDSRVQAVCEKHVEDAKLSKDGQRLF